MIIISFSFSHEWKAQLVQRIESKKNQQVIHGSSFTVDVQSSKNTANTEWEKKLLLVRVIFSFERSGHFNTQSRDKHECMSRVDSVATRGSSAHHAANIVTEVNIVALKAADQHRNIICVDFVIYGAYILRCHT